VDIELFEFDLPPELIAQHPVRRRDESRLMILDRADGSTAIEPFARIVDYIEPGDVLVVNNTKVFKARLWGNRRTGARVEVFLVRVLDDGPGLEWLALVSPSRRVKEGESIEFGDDRVGLVSYLGDGQWRIAFNSRTQRRRIISRHGHVPLPHYIKRDDTPSDIRRYQTVFADSERAGAVAAPTAGFHFTRRILDRLRTKGVELVELTLHVGPGTFKPVKADRIEDHVVDPEFAELSPEAAGTINSARERGGKVFAVGTTSVRTLESAAIENGRIQPLAQMVDLYIRPGHRFRVVDHMITNFHLPKSSLLILVSAFAGREQILKAYGEAVRNRMRFYSYGDAMLIL
jgi:S-adenosylmethionine:tRNA ribosyltransferase-isomerase